MTFNWRKGKHWPRQFPWYWLRWFPLLISPIRIRRRVKFTFDSKYHLEYFDQADVNKLFGFGFLHPRKRSARFGWRWEPEHIGGVFTLLSYCHLNNKEPIFQPVATCVANHWYYCEILIRAGCYNFRVWNENGQEVGYAQYEMGHSRWLGWLLGPYFGGNRTPDRDISLVLEKWK
jgi:hypothetical protein